MQKLVKLGNVCDLKNGFAFKSKLFKKKGLPILRISNIQNERIDTRRPVYFNASDYKVDFKKYEVKPGDLLIAMSGATTGKIGFNESQTTFYLNQRVGKLLPSKDLDKKYLYYLLSSKIEENLKISKGAAQPNLSSEQIRNIDIELLPLPEQQRIVAKLDTAFAEIDKIELKIKNQEELSKKLFRNYLNSIFQDSNFKSFKIENIAGVHSGGTPSTKNKKYWNGIIPWYSSRELNDYITKDSIKKITNLGLEKSNAKIFPKNTLLIGIYDTAAMKMSILHQEGTFNQAIVGIPPNSEFETEYLFFVLNYLKDSILLERRGVRQMNLSLAKIKNIKIPKPSLEEQKTIIYNCNEIRKQTQNLKNICLKKIHCLKLLKKSFLINVFSTDKAA